MTHMHIDTHMYNHTQTHTHTDSHTNTYTQTHTHQYRPTTQIHTHWSASMAVVCKEDTYTRHTYIHNNRQTGTHTHTHTNTHTHTPTPTHTHTSTQTQQQHTYIDTHTHQHRPTYTPTQTPPHTYQHKVKHFPDLPVSIEKGFTWCWHYVPSEHSESGGLSRSVHPQQTKALKHMIQVDWHSQTCDAWGIDGNIHHTQQTKALKHSIQVNMLITLWCMEHWWRYPPHPADQSTKTQHTGKHAHNPVMHGALMAISTTPSRPKH